MSKKEKVYEELLGIYGTEIPNIESVPIKDADLEHLHFLDQVIKETMRLFPPAPIIARQVTNDLKLGLFTFYKQNEIFLIDNCIVNCCYYYFFFINSALKII